MPDSKDTKGLKTQIRTELSTAFHELHTSSGMKSAISGPDFVALIDRWEPVASMILKDAGLVFPNPAVKVVCVGLAKIGDEIKAYADQSVASNTPGSTV